MRGRSAGAGPAQTGDTGAAASGLLHLERRPARTARSVPVPDDLPEAVRAALRRQAVTTLWSHQAVTLDLVRAGHDVVVATGTASGKSLAYQLPAVERLLTDEQALVLYLAPTKALAHDQLRSLRALGVGAVRAGVLDGDTPAVDREAIRRTGNWILTNPDLLHASLLPGHRRWSDVLHRLTLVVVDEAHVARGVFGSHVAMVLRRLRRLAGHYGADPQFLLASATLGNAGAHAASLVGRPVTAVVDDGSPSGELDIALWLPPLEDDDHRRSALTESGDLLAGLVAADVQTLVFARSRQAAEVIARRATEVLGQATSVDGRRLGDTVAAYRAGYLATDRRRIEQELRDGVLRGVAATEALEYGIDVAGLDAVVLAGWPGSRAFFWQRLGRTGRSGAAAVGILVAHEDPLDHYLVTHPREVFDRPPEDAVIDPTNPYVLGPHLRCAAHELPLDELDAASWFGPTAPGLLAEDVAADQLRRRGRRHFWTRRNRAVDEVGLRSASGRRVSIVDHETGVLLGDVDEGRALRQVHPGAIHLHQGRALEVVELDLERAVALVEEPTGPERRTRARVDVDLHVIEEFRHETRGHETRGHVSLGLARVEVREQVTGYDVLRVGSRAVLDRVELELPATELTTVAVWYAIEEQALGAAGLPARRVPGALHAAEHAAIGMLPLLALCDRWDLGGLSTPLHEHTGQPTVFVYDAMPGGAGLAERSFLRIAEHLALTRATIASCACRHGCPSCVQSPKCGNGNEPLDKAGALTVLDVVLAATR